MWCDVMVQGAQPDTVFAANPVYHRLPSTLCSPIPWWYQSGNETVLFPGGISLGSPGNGTT